MSESTVSPTEYILTALASYSEGQDGRDTAGSARVLLFYLTCNMNIYTDYAQSSGRIASLLPNLLLKSLKHAYPKYQTRKDSLTGGLNSIKATDSHVALTVMNNVLQSWENLSTKSVPGFSRERWISYERVSRTMPGGQRIGSGGDV